MCSSKEAGWQTQQHATTPGLILRVSLPDPFSLAARCPSSGGSVPPILSPMWPTAGAVPWEQGDTRMRECGCRAVSPCALNVISMEGFPALLYFQGKCSVWRETVALKSGNISQ